MNLPNRENAYIPQEKLTAYLLSESHSTGQAKAKYLRIVGFNESNVDLLRQGLLSIAQSFEVIDTSTTSHGEKFVIDGGVQAPNGNVIRLRTIWIIDVGQINPRFVTAYPE
jgi:hypothetical protein